MALYLGGLIIRRIFASEIWGAYFWEGLLSEFYGTSPRERGEGLINLLGMQIEQSHGRFVSQVCHRCSQLAGGAASFCGGRKTWRTQ